MKDKQLAYLVLRLALGVNIFMHGAGRLFGSYSKFVDGIKIQFASTILPSWSVTALGYAIPIMETLIGVLLIIGLATRYASVVGSLLMIVLIFGMSLLQKWEIVGIEMNYVFFYFLLLVLIEFNYFSVDEWLLSRTEKR